MIPGFLREAKGCQRFQPKWRELRLFMIDLVDDEGQQDRSFPPIVDGGMDSCDEFFALLLNAPPK